jgi:type IV pilus assembly protein PilC
MATYVAKFIDKNGKERKKTVEADSAERATQVVKAEGHTVLSVDLAGVTNKGQSANQKKTKIKSRDLGVFCRQFESLLRAGVSVINGLEMLAEQTESKPLKAALTNVRDNVEKGDSLAAAMKKEGNVFPGLLINMVEAGEASGSLEIALNRMSTHFDKDAHIKGIVKKALMYPIVLVFVMIAVIIIMLVVVIPAFTDMFKDLDTGLPAFTQAVVNMSDFLIGKWYIVLAVIAAIVVAYKTYAATDAGNHQLAALKLKLPMFGPLNTKTAAARFARNFSTLIAAGMPMIEAIEITASTMDNILFKEELLRLRDQVSLGSSISGYLKSSKMFPSMLCHMIGIGEETGNLEEMLDGCAVYYEEEVELATESLTAAMEPAIIIVMAGVVGLLLVAIFQPMIKLYDTLGNEVQ